MSDWLTPELVLSWQEDESPGSPPGPGEDVDRPALELSCDASAEYVERIHPAGWSTDVPPVYTPKATHKLGAIMLAARLYERRGSLLGVAGYSDLGGSPILRSDPDIARLLEVDGGGRFVFSSTPRYSIEDVESGVVTP